MQSFDATNSIIERYGNPSAIDFSDDLYACIRDSKEDLTGLSIPSSEERSEFLEGSIKMDSVELRSNEQNAVGIEDNKCDEYYNGIEFYQDEMHNDVYINNTMLASDLNLGTSGEFYPVNREAIRGARVAARKHLKRFVGFCKRGHKGKQDDGKSSADSNQESAFSSEKGSSFEEGDAESGSFDDSLQNYFDECLSSISSDDLSEDDAKKDEKHFESFSRSPDGGNTALRKLLGPAPQLPVVGNQLKLTKESNNALTHDFNTSKVDSGKAPLSKKNSTGVSTSNLSGTNKSVSVLTDVFPSAALAGVSPMRGAISLKLSIGESRLFSSDRPQRKNSDGSLACSKSLNELGNKANSREGPSAQRRKPSHGGPSTAVLDELTQTLQNVLTVSNGVAHGYMSYTSDGARRDFSSLSEVKIVRSSVMLINALLLALQGYPSELFYFDDSVEGRWVLRSSFKFVNPMVSAVALKVLYFAFKITRVNLLCERSRGDLAMWMQSHAEGSLPPTLASAESLERVLSLALTTIAVVRRTASEMMIPEYSGEVLSVPANQSLLQLCNWVESDIAPVLVHLENILGAAVLENEDNIYFTDDRSVRVFARRCVDVCYESLLNFGVSGASFGTRGEEIARYMTFFIYAIVPFQRLIIDAALGLFDPNTFCDLQPKRQCYQKKNNVKKFTSDTWSFLPSIFSLQDDNPAELDRRVSGTVLETLEVLCMQGPLGGSLGTAERVVLSQKLLRRILKGLICTKEEICSQADFWQDISLNNFAAVQQFDRCSELVFQTSSVSSAQASESCRDFFNCPFSTDASFSTNRPLALFVGRNCKRCLLCLALGTATATGAGDELEFIPFFSFPTEGINYEFRERQSSSIPLLLDISVPATLWLKEHVLQPLLRALHFVEQQHVTQILTGTLPTSDIDCDDAAVHLTEGKQLNNMSFSRKKQNNNVFLSLLPPSRGPSTNYWSREENYFRQKDISSGFYNYLLLFNNKQSSFGVPLMDFNAMGSSLYRGDSSSLATACGECVEPTIQCNYKKCSILRMPSLDMSLFDALQLIDSVICFGNRLAMVEGFIHSLRGLSNRSPNWYLRKTATELTASMAIGAIPCPAAVKQSEGAPLDINAVAVSYTANKAITIQFLDSLSRTGLPRIPLISVIVVPASRSTGSYGSNKGRYANEDGGEGWGTRRRLRGRLLFSTFMAMRVLVQFPPLLAFLQSYQEQAIKSSARTASAAAIDLWDGVSAMDAYSRVFSLLSILHFCEAGLTIAWLRQRVCRGAIGRLESHSEGMWGGGKAAWELRFANANHIYRFVCNALLEYVQDEVHNAVNAFILRCTSVRSLGSLHAIRAEFEASLLLATAATTEGEFGNTQLALRLGCMRDALHTVLVLLLDAVDTDEEDVELVVNNSETMVKAVSELVTNIDCLPVSSKASKHFNSLLRKLTFNGYFTSRSL